MSCHRIKRGTEFQITPGCCPGVNLVRVDVGVYIERVAIGRPAVYLFSGYVSEMVGGIVKVRFVALNMLPEDYCINDIYNKFNLALLSPNHS